MGQDHYDQAEQSFEDASRLQPGLVGARIQLARVRVKQGKLADALRPLQAMLRKRPKSSGVHRMIAELYVEMGHFDQAVAEFEAALVHDEDLVAEFPEVAEIRASTAEPEEKSKAYLAFFERIKERLAERRAERVAKRKSAKGARKGQEGRAAIRLSLRDR
jgi:predicted Zn-dependent protease